MNISYNIIHKGDPEPLLRCIDSVYSALYRDGDECVIVDTGSSRRQLKRLKRALKAFPGTKLVEAPELSVDYTPYIEKFLGEEYVEEFRAHQKNTTGLLSFADARNRAMEESTHEWIFWIDSDDVLAETRPGNFRSVLDRLLPEEKVDAIFMDYEYAFNPEGTCITLLRRERVIPKSRFFWKGECHETAIPRPGVDMRPPVYFEDIGAKIVHTDARKPHRISDIRNYVILRHELETARAQGEYVDPRTIFYLANSCRGLSLFRQANKFYRMFDHISGSADDRFAAHYYRAAIALDPSVQRPFQALESYRECIHIKPRDPRGFLGMARVYAALRRWEQCAHWYEISQTLAMPKDQVFSWDPTHVNFHGHLVGAWAYRHLQNPDGAMRCLSKAAKEHPASKELRETVDDFKNWTSGFELTQAVGRIAQNLPYRGINATRVMRDICEELTAVPPELEKEGISRREPPEGREPKPSIAIWCGKSGEPWGPGSRHAGIGGSEKMVILLAEELQRTGEVNVTVYADVPHSQRGIHETGVAWYHYSQFDATRPRDVLVFWRQPRAAVQLNSPARLRVAWNHDVQNPATYTDDVLAALDLVQCQSEFHAEPLHGVVPPEKLWIARNAVEPGQHQDSDIPRDPKQVLYCSSPDRGLLTACEIVRRAQLKDPEISFVVTYGVTPWARELFAKQPHRFCPDLGFDTSMDLYETKLYDALDEVNATILNRVGFEEMEVLQRTSGVWLYPTRFPEISCMSAMEAQANGCVPVSTRFGALDETLGPFAVELPMLPAVGPIPDALVDECAEVLVRAVNQEHDRDEMAKEALERFNVADLARQWLDKFQASESFSLAAKDSVSGSRAAGSPFFERIISYGQENQ